MLNEEVVSVNNLWREFKEYKRGAGFKAAIKALFSRTYEKKFALKGVSLSVRKGEIVGLIGPNGAGKSTLIKILTGVLFPSKGEANVLGFVPWKDRVKYAKNIGVIFGQKTQLWWDIPALDTFELHKELYDIPKKDFEKRKDYMIKMLDISEIVKKPVRQLSLGERMKCELTLCLLHNPPLVFLDEPSIGLDVIAKERMRDFIKDFNQKYGTTFIITTHDMNDIEKLCKRVVIINRGIIVYDGLLEEIRQKYANKKIIDCTFSEPLLVRGFEFKGTRILEKSKHKMVLELDLKKATIKRLVDYILKKYGEWEDIDIKDPPIEEIITLIYQKKS